MLGYDRHGLGYSKVGRGNVCPTTINLPRIGIRHGICLGERDKADLNGFWDELDEVLGLAEKANVTRFYHICAQPVGAATFMYQNGTIADYERANVKGIYEAMKHGTLAIGYIGIAEMCQALFGKDHSEDVDVRNFALSVVKHILSLSYGKDSLACLGAIEQLGWPLDRIVHAEVWATDTIPADLPPMVEFKKHADAIIKEKWGIEVEHVCAIDRRGGENCLTKSSSTVDFAQEGTPEESTDSHTQREHGATPFSKEFRLIPSQKLTYEKVFYTILQKGVRAGSIYGFPGLVKMGRSQWCTGRLKERNFPIAP